MTRAVSPTPPSLRFVPDVTLIRLSSHLAPGDLVACGATRRNQERPKHSYKLLVELGFPACPDYFAAGTAVMTTIACAVGPSSVSDTSIWALHPGGVIAASRASAPPVNFMVGRPEGRLITPMSRQNTPRRNPVPSALAQASLAAKRLA